MHLYEEHGDAFVERLRGMFALALWDARRRRLVLARDRFGIKPLYYARLGDALVFASEQKALLASGRVEARPSRGRCGTSLPAGKSCRRARSSPVSRRWPPGHLAAYAQGSLTLSRYWDAAFPAAGDYEERPDQAWADGLRDVLAESVRLHMRSDVAVGAWLSGGIDSSTVAALMSPLAESRVPDVHDAHRRSRRTTSCMAGAR